MFCQKCNMLSDNRLCKYCTDPGRDSAIICVVENPKDVFAIERSCSYKGQYHVLLGTIAPTEGRGPEDLKIQQLLQRIKEEGIEEVVIATDPDNEGEMTALYLIKQLRALNVKISRIGFGIPVGSSVEFADISTLGASLTHRREILDV